MPFFLNKGITLGFTSDQFYIDDWDETNMTVAIQNGSLQDDATIRMMMQVGLPGMSFNTAAVQLIFYVYCR